MENRNPYPQSLFWNFCDFDITGVITLTGVGQPYWSEDVAQGSFEIIDGIVDSQAYMVAAKKLVTGVPLGHTMGVIFNHDVTATEVTSPPSIDVEIVDPLQSVKVQSVKAEDYKAAEARLAARRAKRAAAAVGAVDKKGHV